MNDDADVSIIQGLFAAGLALAVFALLVFVDGTMKFTLLALVVPLLGLGFGAIWLINRRGREARRR